MGPPMLALSVQTAGPLSQQSTGECQGAAPVPPGTFPQHSTLLWVLLLGVCFTCDVQQQESTDAPDREIKKEAMHTKECLVKFGNHSGSDDTEISPKVPCVVFVDIMVPFVDIMVPFVTSLLTNAEFVGVLFLFVCLVF